MRSGTKTYKCKNCNNSFVARVDVRKHGWARFCSKPCKATYQYKLGLTLKPLLKKPRPQCKRCGKTVKDLDRTFCSRECSLKARHLSFIERMAEASLGKAENECWEWPYVRDWAGYGRYRRQLVHRLAYEQAFGRVESGIFICHHCDNPSCCNPSHLFAGTQADNMADMVAKRRHSYGERHVNAKLTENDVREIRKRLSSGGIQRRIAQEFGVNPSAIWHIHHRISWKELEDAPR